MYGAMYILLIMFIMEFILYGTLLYKSVTAIEEEVVAKIKDDPKKYNENAMKFQTKIMTNYIHEGQSDQEIHDDIRSLKTLNGDMRLPGRMSRTRTYDLMTPTKVPKDFPEERNPTLPFSQDGPQINIQEGESFVFQDDKVATISKNLMNKNRELALPDRAEIPELLVNQSVILQDSKRDDSQQQVDPQNDIIDDNAEAEETKKKKAWRWEVPKTAEDLNKEKEKITKKNEELETIKGLTSIYREVVKDMITAGRLDTNKKHPSISDDPKFLANATEVSKEDKIIIKNISTLTTFALVFEIIFAVLSAVSYGTTVLQTPIGVICMVYISSVFELASIISLMLLFQIIHIEKKDNLRLILSIGQTRNKVNKQFRFEIPNEIQNDENRRLKAIINNIRYDTPPPQNTGSLNEEIRKLKEFSPLSPEVLLLNEEEIIVKEDSNHQKAPVIQDRYLNKSPAVNEENDQKKSPVFIQTDNSIEL
jgi:hypothetical protein